MFSIQPHAYILLSLISPLHDNGSWNESFFKLIADSQEQLYQLVENDIGELKIYDFNFTKQPLFCEKIA